MRSFLSNPRAKIADGCGVSTDVRHCDIERLYRTVTPTALRCCEKVLRYIVRVTKLSRLRTAIAIAPWRLPADARQVHHDGDGERGIPANVDRIVWRRSQPRQLREPRRRMTVQVALPHEISRPAADLYAHRPPVKIFCRRSARETATFGDEQIVN